MSEVGPAEESPDVNSDEEDDLYHRGSFSSSSLRPRIMSASSSSNTGHEYSAQLQTISTNNYISDDDRSPDEMMNDALDEGLAPLI